MAANKQYLVCRKVGYYSNFDEDAFFEWIKKIKCIEKFEGAGYELYLDLYDRELSSEDIHEIAALFLRYKINMKQLAEFLTENNKDAFGYYKKEIFGKK